MDAEIQGSPEDFQTGGIRQLMGDLIGLQAIFFLVVVSIELVLNYVWMILGMELFHGNQKGDRCSQAEILTDNPAARFCNYYATNFTLIQLLTTNNWHDVMYATMKVHGPWSSVYFLLFFFMGPMILVSLLMAMFWD